MCDSTDNNFSSLTFFTPSLPQTMPNEWRGVVIGKMDTSHQPVLDYMEVVQMARVKLQLQ